MHTSWDLLVLQGDGGAACLGHSSGWGIEKIRFWGEPRTKNEEKETPAEEIIRLLRKADEMLKNRVLNETLKKSGERLREAAGGEGYGGGRGKFSERIETSKAPICC